MAKVPSSRSDADGFEHVSDAAVVSARVHEACAAHEPGMPQAKLVQKVQPAHPEV